MEFTRSDSRTSMSPEHSAAAKAQLEKVTKEVAELKAQLSEKDERMEELAFELDEAKVQHTMLQEELEVTFLCHKCTIDIR